jgi:hypothetical protein
MIEALIKEKKMLYVWIDWFDGDFDVTFFIYSYDYKKKPWKNSEHKLTPFQTIIKIPLKNWT